MLLIVELFVFLLIVLVLFIFYIIFIYNSLVRLKNNITKAWSNIEVLLKQRYDELRKVN
jgi:LemA protein